jgi:hypothetical protein
MLRSFRPAILLLALCYGCSSYGTPVHFVVPAEFRGPIFLVLDESDGIEVTPTGGKYVYRIPVTGLVRIKSFKPFEPWHKETASYDDGTPIPHELERYKTWRGPHQDDPPIADDAIVFQGGSITQRNDEPHVMNYFVGTASEFAAWQRDREAGQEH